MVNRMSTHIITTEDVIEELTKLIQIYIKNKYNLDEINQNLLVQHIVKKIPDNIINNYLPGLCDFDKEDQFISCLSNKIISNDYVIRKYLFFNLLIS